MGRENKKDAVTALHREQIMTAAEKMFSEKGFFQTTIDDISKSSDYSRRTIYAYFESKEDILHHIIRKGLFILKEELQASLEASEDFFQQYRGFCAAMDKYQRECPHSLDSVAQATTKKIDLAQPSPTVAQILALGTEINTLLAVWIQSGIEKGIVRQEIIPMQTVYVLWSSITALLTLVHTKGPYIAAAFSLSEQEFLDYGYKQILNSILEVRI